MNMITTFTLLLGVLFAIIGGGLIGIATCNCSKKQFIYGIIGMCCCILSGMLIIIY